MNVFRDVPDSRKNRRLNGLNESDTQQIAVDLERTIGLVSEDALGQHLTQLNAFLIEAVQIPAEALEHDLVQIGRAHV